MKTLKLLMSFFLLWTATGLSEAQEGLDPNKPLPLNPNVRYGKLDNGLTYYVLHNEEPKERASFYIVQNVGAILENDEQNGLAHFLEHMAFNGTQNFPGKGILNYLEKYGVAFGRNINAYTNVDETVYNLSNVPTTNPNLLDSTLLVLHDWSHYLLLTEEEINSERGVIHEEWRPRRSGQMRVYLESRKYIFQDSKYADRDVIGSLDVIDHFEPKVIRDFYHDYYRTDLQAIIVVGDIDAARIEEKIKAMFSPIPAVENPKERKYFEVPGNAEPVVGIITDPEAGGLRFTFYCKHPSTAFAKKDMTYYRQNLADELYSNMMGMRFDEMVQKGNPPFIGAYTGYYNMARLADVYTVGANLKEDNIAGGIESALTENERLHRFGFVASELERAKTSMLSEFEKNYKERNKQLNDRLVRELQYHFLVNEPAPGIELEYNLAQQLLPTITLDELNALAKKWNTVENQIYILSGPEKEGLVYPTKDQLLSIAAKVKNAELKPYEDKVINEPLIAETLTGSVVAKGQVLTDFGVTEWTLKNGVKVVVKTTDYKENEILMSAYSEGGSSLYSATELPTIQMIGNFMGAFGVGKFDQVSLQKLLTGKVVKLSPYVGELYEGLQGSSSIKDFETLLQLAYLQMEQPRFDEEAFSALKSRYLASVANLDADINKTFRDSVTLVSNNYNPRTVLMNTNTVQKLDFATMQKVYQERFADAANFTFVFVGNIDTVQVKPLIEKYLGSLITEERSEKWMDTKVEYPNDGTMKHFQKTMETPKTTIYLNLHGEMKYNPTNRILLDMVAELLDKRYTDVIREEEGGTYGVSVRANVSHFPKEQYSLIVAFDTDPAKSDKLKGIVYAEMDSIHSKGVKLDDLNEAMKNFIKVRQENLRKNNYWMSAINQYYQHGETVVVPSAYEDIVNAVTPEQVEAFAKTYLPKSARFEVVMSPAQ